MRVKKDIVAVTGSYTNREGQEKKNFLKVGSLMEGDNGDFIMLDASFNPAGVPRKEGKSSIVLSLYDPKEKGAAAPADKPASDLDGESIPF